MKKIYVKQAEERKNRAGVAATESDKWDQVKTIKIFYPWEIHFYHTQLIFRIFFLEFHSLTLTHRSWVSVFLPLLFQVFVNAARV